MRKLVLPFALIVLAFSGAANAQFCINFDNFSDGISMTIGVEGVISAVWENHDGAGAEAPMLGFTQVAGSANVLVCSDPSCPRGNQYAFFIAYPIRSFWLYDLTNGTSVVAESPFSLSGGACPFGPVEEGVPSVGY